MALWNGQRLKAFGHLADLRAWTWTARADPSWLSQLRTHLCELTHYLDANADSLPNYGARYRAGATISTAFVESAVNEIVSRRMVKRQQMRWNRFTVQPFLTVRVHVLNATLEAAFRHWHRAFRPGHPCRDGSRGESGVGAPRFCILSITTRPENAQNCGIRHPQLQSSERRAGFRTRRLTSSAEPDQSSNPENCLPGRGL
jgi:hypothetical protein